MDGPVLTHAARCRRLRNLPGRRRLKQSGGEGFKSEPSFGFFQRIPRGVAHVPHLRAYGPPRVGYRLALQPHGLVQHPGERGFG